MPRELKIIPVLNGWIVEAGCQRCVFGDLGQLCTALGDYYRDPEATEARFLKDAKNKVVEQPPATPAPQNIAGIAPPPVQEDNDRRDPNAGRRNPGSIPQEIRR
jgi:hypothetical protein